MRDKEGHYIIRGTNHQENITIVNIYATKFGAPEFIKHILTDPKEEIDSNTKIVQDFNAPLKTKDRSFRWEISKETVDWNYTSDQMGLPGVNRALHQQNTHSSTVHMAYSPG